MGDPQSSASRETISARDIRHRFADIAKRLQAGEAFDLTMHGRVIGHMVPAQMRGLARLEAMGAVRNATRDIRDLPPPSIKLPQGVTAQQLLDEQREDFR
jgi:antitoxin (DNA-binding transcriptional repressor) of toxin-antitoxin stability system